MCASAPAPPLQCLRRRPLTPCQMLPRALAVALRPALLHPRALRRAREPAGAHTCVRGTHHITLNGVGKGRGPARWVAVKAGRRVQQLRAPRRPAGHCPLARPLAQPGLPRRRQRALVIGIVPVKRGCVHARVCACVRWHARDLAVPLCAKRRPPPPGPPAPAGLLREPPSPCPSSHPPHQCSDMGRMTRNSSRMKVYVASATPDAIAARRSFTAREQQGSAAPKIQARGKIKPMPKRTLVSYVCVCVCVWGGQCVSRSRRGGR